MDSNQLLQGLMGRSRTLGSGAIGVNAGGRAGGSAAGEDFSALLAQARAGQLESGRGVTIGKSAGGLQLSVEQQTRLGQAIDAAEANGSQRALVVMDGVGYSVDVATRTITGAARMDAAGPMQMLTNFDARMILPGNGSGASGSGGGNVVGGSQQIGAVGGLLPPPGVNPVMMAQMAGRSGQVG
jgi:hypothetical protein